MCWVSSLLHGGLLMTMTMMITRAILQRKLRLTATMTTQRDQGAIAARVIHPHLALPLHLLLLPLPLLPTQLPHLKAMVMQHPDLLRVLQRRPQPHRHARGQHRLQRSSRCLKLPLDQHRVHPKKWRHPVMHLATGARLMLRRRPLPHLRHLEGGPHIRIRRRRKARRTMMTLERVIWKTLSRCSTACPCWFMRRRTMSKSSSAPTDSSSCT